MSWLMGVGFLLITFVAFKALASSPYKRRDGSSGGGGDSSISGPGGDCGGDGGD